MNENELKDFYRILGVPRDANQDDIKNAYRRLVRKAHPDITQCSNTQQFRDIQEAYETLSNSKKRNIYNNYLVQKEAKQIDIRRHGTTDFQVFPLFFESLFNRIMDSFTDSSLHWDFQRHKDLSVEIILSPDEAKSGGVIPLKVPIIQRCTKCHGTGGILIFECPDCQGNGSIQFEQQIKINVPVGVKDNTVLKLNLNQKYNLIIRICISS